MNVNGHRNGHISHLYVRILTFRHVENQKPASNFNFSKQVLEPAYQPQQDDSKLACYYTKIYSKSNRCSQEVVLFQ